MSKDTLKIANIEVVRYAYMDKVDFDHEVGCALGGNKVYPSLKDLLENEKCVHECGIVKVKIVLEEVIMGSRYSANEEEKKARKEELKQLAENGEHNGS